MRKDKAHAIAMRRNGMSYKAIKNTLKIPKSTLSGWFADEQWSEEIKERLIQENTKKSTLRIEKLNHIRGKKLFLIYEKARQEALEELEVLKYNPLFIAGVMLYWGEGSKTIKGQVRLANTDPEMIKVFSIFLQEVCGVHREDVKASLTLYPDLNEDACRAHWSSKTGIALNQFKTASVIQGRHKTKRHRWGVCTVYVSSTYFRVKMLEWLKLFPKKLIDGQ